MRTLVFDETEESEKRWDIVYGGFIMSPYNWVGTQQILLAAQVQEKLELLATKPEKPVADTPTQIQMVYSKKGGTIQLEENEYNALKQALEQVPWKAIGAAKAAPVYQWFTSIEADKPTLVKS